MCSKNTDSSQTNAESLFFHHCVFQRLCLDIRAYVGAHSDDLGLLSSAVTGNMFNSDSVLFFSSPGIDNGGVLPLRGERARRGSVNMRE